MPNSLPERLTLKEVLTELSLEGSKILFVEGVSDRRFFRLLLNDLGAQSDVSIRSIDEVDIADDLLSSRGFNLGNRSRAIVLALEAERFSQKLGLAKLPLLAIADRDIGEHVDTASSRYLCWTDFPALESYAATPRVLDRARLQNFQERLPESSAYFADLTAALVGLYFIRKNNPHMSRPKYGKGLMRKTRGGGLAGFDASAACAHLSTQPPAQSPESVSDPREFTYGHDLSGLLLAGFDSQLRKADHITPESVEASLLSAVLASRAMEDTKLFATLKEWVASSSARP